LHDASDQQRTYLDELDLNLSPLTATLLIIVIVIITSHRSPISLVATAGVVTSEVVARRGLIESVGILNVGHFGQE
jgi:hypothetical protein